MLLLLALLVVTCSSTIHADTAEVCTSDTYEMTLGKNVTRVANVTMLGPCTLIFSVPPGTVLVLVLTTISSTKDSALTVQFPSGNSLPHTHDVASMEFCSSFGITVARITAGASNVSLHYYAHLIEAPKLTDNTYELSSDISFILLGEGELFKSYVQVKSKSTLSLGVSITTKTPTITAALSKTIIYDGDLQHGIPIGNAYDFYVSESKNYTAQNKEISIYDLGGSLSHVKFLFAIDLPASWASSQRHTPRKEPETTTEEPEPPVETNIEEENDNRVYDEATKQPDAAIGTTALSLCVIIVCQMLWMQH